MSKRTLPLRPSHPRPQAALSTSITPLSLLVVCQAAITIFTSERMGLQRRQIRRSRTSDQNELDTTWDEGAEQGGTVRHEPAIRPALPPPSAAQSPASRQIIDGSRRRRRPMSHTVKGAPMTSFLLKRRLPGSSCGACDTRMDTVLQDSAEPP
jgi:hypothetical protein